MDMPLTARPLAAPRRTPLLWYSLLLFLGYCALLLLLYMPLPYVPPALGLLAAELTGGADWASRLNPVLWLNRLAGDQAVNAFRAELTATLALLAAAYLLLLRYLRNGASIGLRTILLGIVAFSLPLLCLPYLLSHDLFSYISYGRIPALYGGNPLIEPPSAFPQDPLLRYVIPIYRDTVAVYGPVWILFSHGLTLLVELLGGGLWRYILAYKLALAVLHLGNTLLIWRILGLWKPRQQVWGTVLYAWNPLALIEFVGSVHNDALMITLLLAAILGALRGRWRLALLALLAAGLVKSAALVLLPFYGLWVLLAQPDWRARLWAVAQALLIVAVVLLVTPYLSGLAMLRSFVTNPVATGTINSLADLAIAYGPRELHALGLTPPASTWSAADRAALAAGVQFFSRSVFVLAWLIALVALWRRPTLEQFVRSSFWVFMVLLLFAAPWFWPWYVTWPVALAALLDWQWAGRVAVTFAASAPLIYVPIAARLRIPLAFLPTIVLLGYLLWRERRTAARLSVAPR